MRTNVSLDAMGALIEGNHDNPREILGPHEVEHQGRKAVAVRAFLPDADQVWVVDEAQKKHRPMRRLHPAGIFEAICPMSNTESEAQSGSPRYHLKVSESHGDKIMHDPYAFPELLTDYDLYLLGEGAHSDSYNKLGAQVRTIDGVAGVNFAVWAPNAQNVSIVGDFNSWDARRNPMMRRASSGFWELFIPGLEAGEIYKFRIKSRDGEILDKADPCGFAAELPPRTGSVVADLNSYEWQDADWIKSRETNDQLSRPISVYEVHLGSWRRDPERLHGWKDYRTLAHELVEYCQEMGFTHVELMPVSEHPFTGSWGYQTVGYFAATSRYGSPEDLMYFVDHCHQHGIGVILDWVPAHFPRDAHGLRRFDGSALYEHADPRQGEHPDWGTMIFNYGRNEVRNFLVSNALFWIDKFHIDGLRVDAVASMLYLDYSRDEGEWVPNQHGGRENLEAISLLKEFNEKAHAQFPGILTIAEESTSWGGVSHPTSSGGLGFSLKWNMGWMNDTLRYMHREPIHRTHHHDELTFSLIYAFTENFSLPLSHDEVVHGKGALLDQMPGDAWQKFANLRLLYSYMWTHPGKKLLFMGSEWGQWNEWNCEAGLQWDLLQWDTHQGIQRLIRDLNQLYRSEPALHEVDFDAEGFEWIDCMSREESVLAYMRKAKDGNHVVVCCNFTPVVRREHRIGLPSDAYYKTIFNSDSEHYGGSNVGSDGTQGEAVAHHGRSCSGQIALPPLGVIILKPQD